MARPQRIGSVLRARANCSSAHVSCMSWALRINARRHLPPHILAAVETTGAARAHMRPTVYVRGPAVPFFVAVCVGEIVIRPMSPDGGVRSAAS